MIRLAMMLAAQAPLTAGDLTILCADKNTYACDLFILGVAQTAAIGTFPIKGQPGRICIPDDVPIDQLRARFTALAAADFAAFPQDRDMPAVSLVLAVLRKSYSCPS